MAKQVDLIKTQRLFLRGIDESDVDNIVEWRSDPDVYKHFKFPHKITREEHLAWFNDVYKDNENRFDWMCIEQETGKKIGVFGLIKNNDYAEVNYILAPEAQHKGYATEAIKALINIAREDWGLSQIVAEINRNNDSSVSFIIKQGFHIISSDGDFDTYSMEITK